jgi:putative ABC transport system permease protein
METRFTGKKNSGLHFWIQAVDIDLVDQAVAELKVALRRLHKSEDYFDFFIAQEIIKRVGSVSKILQLLLAGVAGISLFVGGIGIMNIMLVSVTERTREIGLRKAVGAKGFDIRLQFLLESVLLSIIGGTIGILISSGLALGAALAVTKFLIKDSQWPASFSINAAAAAFLVSTVIGVTFGLYPAIKASRLQPTEALRYE